MRQAHAEPAGWGKGTQVAKLRAEGGVSGDFLGDSVAVSADGSTAVVGASGRNGGAGSAYVFIRQSDGDGGTWQQAAELTASDSSPDSSFGDSVSISADGSWIAIGADGTADSAGTTYVFRGHEGSWKQVAALGASDEEAGDDFGGAVSLSADGHRLVVGAFMSSNGEGTAYVFTRSHRSWAQTAELTAPDGVAGDEFGEAVSSSADGSAIVIGAPFAPGATDVGAAYVFTQHRGTWTVSANVKDPSGLQGDIFGTDVAISGRGTTVVIGAEDDVTGTGAAYVYSHHKTGWGSATELQSSDGAPGDGFGSSVDISATGRTIAVGAVAHDGFVGAAYLFVRRHTSPWKQVSELEPSDGASGDIFGHRLALSSDGSTLVVGAMGADSFAGAAYVFSR